MVIARGCVEEAVVAEVEFASLRRGPQFDGDQRDSLWRALPGPGEAELAVDHHLLVDARDLMVFSILVLVLIFRPSGLLGESLPNKV